MKTIFIIAGGIADLPDPELEGLRRLESRRRRHSTPSQNAAACGSLLAVDEEVCSLRQMLYSLFSAMTSQEVCPIPWNWRSSSHG